MTLQIRKYPYIKKKNVFMWIGSQTSGPVRHVSLTGCYVTAFDFPTPSDDAVNMVNEVQIYVEVIIKNVKQIL